jgi:hypothetical protein
LSKQRVNILRCFASVQRIKGDVTPEQNPVSKRRRYGRALGHSGKQRRY